MKKHFLLFVLLASALTVAANEYTDPETKVVYTYDPKGTTATVKAGYDMPPFDDEGSRSGIITDGGEIEYYPGSPEASGDIAILDKFVVDGKEYTVTAIGLRAFYDCRNITSVIIPQTVTTIGYLAFASCRSLAKVYSMIEEPFEICCFDGLASPSTLYVPIGTKSKYEATMGWTVFDNIEEMDAQAQTSQLEYRPFVEEGKTWSVETDFDWDNSFDYYIRSDTLIDATVWKKTTRIQGEYIFEDYYAAAREEDKKVYAIEAEKNTPHLIYDFGLKVGDVVQLVRSKNSSFRWIENSDVSPADIEDGVSLGTMTLTGIDVARTLGLGWKQEAGAPFRRFTFTTSWTDGKGEPNTVVWVEGVGSDGGPFIPWHDYKELKTNELNLYSVICEKDKKTVFFGDEFYVGMDEHVGEDDMELWSEYTDPETRVVYTYDPNGTTAMVKAGKEIWDDPNWNSESEEISVDELVCPGSPEATGNITILDKFVANGREYTVTAIGSNAFFGCKDIISVTIPETVTRIGFAAFYFCQSMTSVILPNSLKEIDESVFNCTGIQSVTIPASMTTIGNNSFITETLTEIYSLSEDPIETKAFGSMASYVYANTTLFVPKGCKKKYTACNGWNRFYKIEEIDVTGIGGAPHLNEKMRNEENEKMRNNKRGGVYDLQGRRIGASLNDKGQMANERMKKGVYINDGRKIVVK